MTKIYGIEVRAAFHVAGRWQWHSFKFPGGNKHAAILAKAAELNADRWDFGNADVSEVQVIAVKA